MSGRVITVTSGKGGVGKTTTTANLAVALARLGKRVVCLDFDIGLRNLDLVLGLENRVVYDLIDVVEGRARLQQALVKDRELPGLYLLPGSQWRDKTALNARQAVRLCKDLAVQFDFVLIDSPAGIEEGFRNALAPADLVLIVTMLEMPSVQDADRVIALVQASEKPAPKMIVNRARKALTKRGDAPDALRVTEFLGIELIGVVPEDQRVIAETNRGKPVVFNKRSPASHAFTRIARRILGEPLPISTYGETEGWLKRLSGLLQGG